MTYDDVSYIGNFCLRDGRGIGLSVSGTKAAPLQFHLTPPQTVLLRTACLINSNSDFGYRGIFNGKRFLRFVLRVVCHRCVNRFVNARPYSTSCTSTR